MVKAMMFKTLPVPDREQCLLESHYKYVANGRGVKDGWHGDDTVFLIKRRAVFL